MSKNHYTNQGIRKSKRLSVNLVSREMLPKADYVGSVSGTTVDKSGVFAYHVREKCHSIPPTKSITSCNKLNDYSQNSFNFSIQYLNTQCYTTEKIIINQNKK
jgi:hypothetical protein